MRFLYFINEILKEKKKHFCYPTWEQWCLVKLESLGEVKYIYAKTTQLWQSTTQTKVLLKKTNKPHQKKKAPQQQNPNKWTKKFKKTGKYCTLLLSKEFIDKTQANLWSQK